MCPTGSMLDPDLGDHVCVPFRGEGERRAAARLFTLNGLRRRVKVVIVAHAEPPERTRDWLAPLVPGFTEAEAAGQVELRASAGAHLTGGRPDPGRALRGLADTGRRAREQGFRGVYALVDASWGAGDPPGQVAFEAAANALFGQGWLAAVCQYDRALFPREALDRATAVHPISPEQALLRYAATCSPRGLRLWGDIDLTNRQAFASVLEPLRRERGEVVIDASEVDFIDAASAQLLVAAVTARPAGRTVVVCGRPTARMLRLMRAGDSVTVRLIGDV